MLPVEKTTMRKGDGDALEQVVGCAADAAVGAPMVGSPDVADVPTVSDQVVCADRWGSTVRLLPQPAITNYAKKSLEGNFNAPLVAR